MGLHHRCKVVIHFSYTIKWRGASPPAISRIPEHALQDGVLCSLHLRPCPAHQLFCNRQHQSLGRLEVFVSQGAVKRLLEKTWRVLRMLLALLEEHRTHVHDEVCSSSPRDPMALDLEFRIDQCHVDLRKLRVWKGLRGLKNLRSLLNTRRTWWPGCHHDLVGFLLDLAPHGGAARVLNPVLHSSHLELILRCPVLIDGSAHLLEDPTQVSLVKLVAPQGSPEFFRFELRYLLVLGEPFLDRVLFQHPGHLVLDSVDSTDLVPFVPATLEQFRLVMDHHVARQSGFVDPVQEHVIQRGAYSIMVPQELMYPWAVFEQPVLHGYRNGRDRRFGPLESLTSRLYDVRSEHQTFRRLSVFFVQTIRDFFVELLDTFKSTQDFVVPLGFKT